MHQPHPDETHQRGFPAPCGLSYPRCSTSPCAPQHADHPANHRLLSIRNRRPPTRLLWRRVVTPQPWRRRTRTIPRFHTRTLPKGVSQIGTHPQSFFRKLFTLAFGRQDPNAPGLRFPGRGKSSNIKHGSNDERSNITTAYRRPELRLNASYKFADAPTSPL